MKTKYYDVDVLKKMGEEIHEDVMEGQLTIFKPKPKEEQMTMDSLLPKIIKKEVVYEKMTIDSLFPRKERKRAHKQLVYSYAKKNR